MKIKTPLLILCLSILIVSCNRNKTRELCLNDYRNKMKAAWIGQMAGVGWGLPTEFKFSDRIIPMEKVPEWNTDMINQQGNDDLYVELTFLASMVKHGIDVSQEQAGIDFANTAYRLWAANQAGRENLRSGIAPPSSGHPEFSDHSDDIDYQIEADYSGIIAPGMPNVAIALGEKFGRIMNYGDGLWGGMFVGGMYAEAFFETDIHTILEAGLECIPDSSLYEQCIRDVMKGYKEFPDNWTITWNRIEDKYHKSDQYQPFAKEHDSWVPIDAKLNGAYIAMGLLYGEGDMDKTIEISMRCGKDSDCNPSNAGGILATTIGYKNLPERYKTGLDTMKKFSYSNYNFNDLLRVSEYLTRQLIENQGGSIKKDLSGNDYFSIPVQKINTPAFTPSYSPLPSSAKKFTEEEMNKIRFWSSKDYEVLFEKTGLSIQVNNAGKSVKPEIMEWNGRKDIIRTGIEAPNNRILLSGDAGDDAKRIVFSVGYEDGQSFDIQCKRGWEILFDSCVNQTKSRAGWMDFEIPLEKASARNFEIVVTNQNKDNVSQYWSGFKAL